MGDADRKPYNQQNNQQQRRQEKPLIDPHIQLNENIKMIHRRLESLEDTAGKDNLSGKMADIHLITGDVLESRMIRKVTKYDILIESGTGNAILKKHAILMLDNIK